MLSQYNISATSGNVRPVQNNAERILNYINLTYNSSLFSLTAERTCVPCRLSLNDDAVFWLFWWFIQRWDATAVSQSSSTPVVCLSHRGAFSYSEWNRHRNALLMNVFLQYEEWKKTMWRLESRISTAKCASTLWVQRDWLEERYNTLTVFAHWVPHFNWHLASFTYIS